MALVPRIDTPGYVPALAALVREHDVRLVDPAHGSRPGRCSPRSRDALAPALVLVPEPEVCEAMGDKWLAHVFFEEHGIPSPRSWLPDDVADDARYPLLVKVREGFGSRHIYRAHDREQLAFHLRTTPVDSFVQERAAARSSRSTSSATSTGRCLNAIPRTMIQSKGGESIKGRSIRDWELIEHGRMVAETIGIRGPANIQCFREPDGALPGHGREPTFRRSLPAPARRGRPVPRARARAGARRTARAAARRVSRRSGDDPFLLGPLPRRGADGTLVPIAEEHPHPAPIAFETGES